MKPKVIISSNKLSNEILKIFEASLSDIAEVRFSSFSITGEFLNELKDAEVLVLVTEELNEELLNYAPKLKLVARFGVGYDTVDVEACTKRGIYVTHTPGVLSNAVAELTMGLMICLSRVIVRADRFVRTAWAKPDAIPLPLGVDLAGKVLGIIGLGRIGYEVARRAKAFDMKLLYYDKALRDEAEKELGIQRVELDDLLRKSDFISIHVPLTRETVSLIGERELKLMKRTAFLINTSRGRVVDELALCKALENSWIAGAALDVFVKEPLPLESPLIKMENVVLTPHMGSYTNETRRAMALSVIENVRKVLHGETPPNLVPEQKGKVFQK